MSTEETTLIEENGNVNEYLTDSLMGIIDETYDLNEVKTERLNEKYEVEN